MAERTERHPATGSDLDEQIALAELAVIARDRRIRHRADALVTRVKREALQHAGGGALLGLGAVALAWWLKRRARKNPPPRPPAGEPPHGLERLLRDAGVTLAGLLPMLWPVLPRAWRLVSPSTAGTLLTFAAPLLGRLFRRKPRPASPA